MRAVAELSVDERYEQALGGVKHLAVESLHAVDRNFHEATALSMTHDPEFIEATRELISVKQAVDPEDKIPNPHEDALTIIKSSQTEIRQVDPNFPKNRTTIASFRDDIADMARDPNRRDRYVNNGWQQVLSSVPNRMAAVILILAANGVRGDQKVKDNGSGLIAGLKQWAMQEVPGMDFIAPEAFYRIDASDADRNNPDLAEDNENTRLFSSPAR